MSTRTHLRDRARLTLLLALTLVWPVAPVSVSAAQATTIPDDNTACVQCCVHCDDAGVRQAPCSGNAMGCLGLTALAARVESPPPAAAPNFLRGPSASLRSRVADAEHPPPKLSLSEV